MPSIFFCFIIVLSGCGTEYKTFKGEGELWSAEMKFMMTSDYETSDITLLYHGDDPGSVGDFEYSLDYVVGGTAGTGAKLSDGGVFQTSGGSSNGANIMDHHEIEVTVNWKDETETFTLKHNN